MGLGGTRKGCIHILRRTKSTSLKIKNKVVGVLCNKAGWKFPVLKEIGLLTLLILLNARFKAGVLVIPEQHWAGKNIFFPCLLCERDLPSWYCCTGSFVGHCPYLALSRCHHRPRCPLVSGLAGSWLGPVSKADTSAFGLCKYTQLIFMVNPISSVQACP